MQVANTEARWGAVSKAFHWILAILILSMVPFGWWFEDLEDLQLRIQMIQWHKTTGFIVFAMVLGRLLWRAFHPVPKLPDDMKGLERRAAHAGHGLLYAAILAQPLIGIVLVQSSPLYAQFPIRLGPFSVPDLVPDWKPLGGAMTAAHSVVAWTILVLVGIHVIAALKHHFVDKTDVLVRMLPGRWRAPQG